MCRLAAVRNDDPGVVAAFLEAFRTQAQQSSTGPADHRVHPDGWGIVALTPRGLEHLGRSAGDAAADPAYDVAVVRAREAVPGSWVLAHVRNASVGARRVQNSHPFVRDGWAFAHNGTVHDLAAPEGVQPEGDTDSERFFLHVLRANAPTMDKRLRRASAEIAATHRHSSLTCLLTDGRRLLAQRRVGPDPGGCGTRTCALEYYALGSGTWRGVPVFAQETVFLEELESWSPLADDEVRAVEAFAPHTTFRR